MPEESPVHYVKDLRFSLGLGKQYGTPEEIFKYTPWFTKTETLVIEAGEIDLMQMRDIMVHLPNLNNLILSGTIIVRFRKLLPGLGTDLRRRFGGELRIRNGRTDKDFVNMLLEVPTGLHFTKLYVYANRACLLQAVRLAEACRETLVELLYLGFIQGKYHPFRSPSLTGSICCTVCTKNKYPYITL